MNESKQQGIGLCLAIGMTCTGNPTLFARFSKKGNQCFDYKSISTDFRKPAATAIHFTRFKEFKKTNRKYIVLGAIQTRVLNI